MCRYLFPLSIFVEFVCYCIVSFPSCLEKEMLLWIFFVVFVESITKPMIFYLEKQKQTNAMQSSVDCKRLLANILLLYWTLKSQQNRAYPLIQEIVEFLAPSAAYQKFGRNN